MPYESVDKLQNALAEGVFAWTKSPKKAAGRSLGTLVELITFYMLRDWGLERYLAIERGLPEYGNAQILHNVEFTLHPTVERHSGSLKGLAHGQSLTARRLLKRVPVIDTESLTVRTRNLIDSNGNVRHVCNFADDPSGFWIVFVTDPENFEVSKLTNSPVAMFECKRVGVEEGQAKGPQTIEKAKQGAYVARSVSGLQRVPRRDGSVAAIVEQADGSLTTHLDYEVFIQDAIAGRDRLSLENVVLTVGVVSNHGNWFTADTQNKEMKVLAQSYDWLLFLTDSALGEFISTALQGTDGRFEATRSAFQRSYAEAGGTNCFTKVVVDLEADRELSAYFAERKPWQEWCNVISPQAEIETLHSNLHILCELMGPEAGK